MSTKIFNGYKMPQMSLKNLDLFVKNARQEIHKAYVQMGESILIQRSVQLLDAYYLFGEEEVNKMLGESRNFKASYSPYFLAYLDLDEKSRKSEKSDLRVDSMYDFKSSICLFPIRGKVLAMFFSQQEPLTNVWNALEGVEEYCYWNNTDKPDELSNYQWDRRRKDWDTALTGIGVPSECGFIVEFTKGFPSLFDMKLDENAHKYIDNLDTRAKSYAKNMVLNDKFKELMEGVDKENGMSVYYDACKWLKSDEGQNEVIKKIEEIKKIILPEITFDILKTDFQDLKK